MSGYSKWDRDDYVDRVGGTQEAERRRKALLARVDAQRLVGRGQLHRELGSAGGLLKA